MKRRIHSFVWGGLACVTLIVIGLIYCASIFAFGDFPIFCVLGVLSFTLVSCLILDNNFVGDMISEIFSWGFVRMPGLIFTLDLDGIVWLLTVKLLFWVLGFVLALLCGALAIALGLIVSVFVYPYSIYKNVTGGTEEG